MHPMRPSVRQPEPSFVRRALRLAVCMGFVGLVQAGCGLAYSYEFEPGATGDDAADGADGPVTPADDGVNLDDDRDSDGDVSCSGEAGRCRNDGDCCTGFSCGVQGRCGAVRACVVDADCRERFGPNAVCNPLFGTCNVPTEAVCQAPCGLDSDCRCDGYVCNALLATCVPSGPACSKTTCGVAGQSCCEGYLCSFGSCVSVKGCEAGCADREVCDGATDRCVPDCRYVGCRGGGNLLCDERTGLCRVCTPFCGIRECGGDGCGGTCGTCGQGEDCILGACTAYEEPCVPPCGAGQVCVNGACQLPGECNPPCQAGETCSGGRCEIPACVGERQTCETEVACCAGFTCVWLSGLPGIGPASCRVVCDPAVGCAEPGRVCEQHVVSLTYVCCDPMVEGDCTTTSTTTGGTP
jgi:hypothetical protein